MGTSGMLSNGTEGNREAVEGGRLKGGTIKLRRSRHHNPLNPLNLHTEGVSKGVAARRLITRMPIKPYGTER